MANSNRPYLNRMDRASAERRALRRAEREVMLRVVGQDVVSQDDEQAEAPDAAVIAASARDSKPYDPRSGL